MERLSLSELKKVVVLNQVKEAWIIISSPNYGILGKKNESGAGENWRKRIWQKQTAKTNNVAQGWLD